MPGCVTPNSFWIPGEVEFLSLDIWETILRGNSRFSIKRAEIIQTRLGLPGSAESVLPVYREVGKMFDSKSEESGNDYGFRARVGEICRRLGCQIPDMGDDLVQSIQLELGAMRSLPLYLPGFMEPDLLETLYALFRRYRIILLSNTGFDSGVSMEPVLEQLGILQFVSQGFFSSDYEWAKPNELLYEFVNGELGIVPRQILHVGNSVPADFEGATGAGWHGVVYAPNGQPYKDGQPLPFIRSLRELV